MSEERKPHAWPWIVALLICMPVLYVLSSGPMQTVAFRSHVAHFPAPGGSGVTVATMQIEMGGWWPSVYAPLLWTSEQSWGEALNWYWQLFPIPDGK